MKINILCYITIMSLFLTGVTQAETFKVFTSELPPYIYTEKKKATGIAVEIVDELFNRSNIKYELLVRPLARVLKEVKKKGQKYSCGMPLQRSQEREYFYQWVGPLLITRSSVLTSVKQSDKVDVKVLKDLLNYKVGSLRGADEGEYLSGFGVDIDWANSEKSSVGKLKKGRTDLWATDNIAGPYYAKLNGLDVVEKFVFKTTLRALACNLETNPDTLKVLENNLSKMYEDGTMERIFKKYAKKFNISEESMIF